MCKYRLCNFFVINRRCGEEDDHRACFVLVEVSDRMFVNEDLCMFSKVSNVFKFLFLAHLMFIQK